MPFSLQKLLSGFPCVFNNTYDSSIRMKWSILDLIDLFAPLVFKSADEIWFWIERKQINVNILRKNF